MATAAGVISGMVAVPMIVQLKTAQISPVIELRYGYTRWYQIIGIVVCATLHIIADVIALTSVLLPRQWDEEFLNKMKEYKVKRSSKSVIDNIQWALQCCGSLSYKDWHIVEWTKISVRRSLVDIIRDTAGYSETAMEVDAVPFSCCARKILETCMHYNVVQYGTKTISVGGCSFKVKHTAQLILWSEFGVYATCILIESELLPSPPTRIIDMNGESIYIELESGQINIRGDANSGLNKTKVNKINFKISRVVTKS
ncbi:hypothetical protein Trydic_g734 [Trypoxylus dichotomus]